MGDATERRLHVSPAWNHTNGPGTDGGGDGHGPAPGSLENEPLGAD